MKRTIANVSQVTSPFTASYGELAAASNPAVELNLTVRVGAELAAGQTARAELVWAASATGERLLLSLAVAGGPAPSANFTMDRSGTPVFGGSGEGMSVYSVEVPESAASSSRAFTVRGFLDRSVLEVYLNGGAAFGTLLFFANGTMDSVSLQGSAEELSFDFCVVPLKSSWGVPS